MNFNINIFYMKGGVRGSVMGRIKVKSKVSVGVKNCGGKLGVGLG